MWYANYRLNPKVILLLIYLLMIKCSYTFIYAHVLNKCNINYYRFIYIYSKYTICIHEPYTLLYLISVLTCNKCYMYY